MNNKQELITLYWYPRSRASRAAWLLEELAVPYERVFVDIRDEQARQEPGFRAASPMGKVPALRHGELHMSDSSAMALYLADRFPAAGLAPAVDDVQRGQYLYWCTYTPGVIEPAMMERFGNWTVNRQSSGWGDFDLMIETLENALENKPWILGESFSAADTLLGSSAHFMQVFGLLPESETLTGYLDRCRARPAFERAMAFDDEHAEPSA